MQQRHNKQKAASAKLGGLTSFRERHGASCVKKLPSRSPCSSRTSSQQDMCTESKHSAHFMVGFLSQDGTKHNSHAPRLGPPTFSAASHIAQSCFVRYGKLDRIPGSLYLRMRVWIVGSMMTQSRKSRHGCCSNMDQMIASVLQSTTTVWPTRCKGDCQ